MENHIGLHCTDRARLQLRDTVAVIFRLLGAYTSVLRRYFTTIINKHLDSKYPFWHICFIYCTATIQSKYYWSI